MTFGAPAVLNISYGFARVTAPELTVEMKEVKEGTLENKHYIPMAATVSPITLERGVSIFNADFANWVISVTRGVANQRRNFLLIHYSDAGVFSGPSDTSRGVGLDLVNQVFPIQDLFARTPARAWMLYSCLPISYKAGSDFDALGNEISIAQLTVQPQFVTEINLGLV